LFLLSSKTALKFVDLKKYKVILAYLTVNSVTQKLTEEVQAASVNREILKRHEV
jgi:hypothetical protein